MFDKTVLPFSTTAAAVSSHELSIPKIFIVISSILIELFFYILSDIDRFDFLAVFFGNR